MQHVSRRYSSDPEKLQTASAWLGSKSREAAEAVGLARRKALDIDDEDLVFVNLKPPPPSGGAGADLLEYMPNTHRDGLPAPAAILSGGGGGGDSDDGKDADGSNGGGGGGGGHDSGGGEPGGTGAAAAAMPGQGGAATFKSSFDAFGTSLMSLGLVAHRAGAASLTAAQARTKDIVAGVDSAFTAGGEKWSQHLQGSSALDAGGGGGGGGGCGGEGGPSFDSDRRLSATQAISDGTGARAGDSAVAGAGVDAGVGTVSDPVPSAPSVKGWTSPDGAANVAATSAAAVAGETGEAETCEAVVSDGEADAEAIAGANVDANADVATDASATAAPAPSLPTNTNGPTPVGLCKLTSHRLIPTPTLQSASRVLWTLRVQHITPTI
jgi:hypothetical protein